MARNSKAVVPSSVIPAHVQSEAKALEAIKGMATSREGAGAAMLQYVIDCKADVVTIIEFEEGLARLATGAAGADKVTVGGYVSNCRRIFACPAKEWEEVKALGLTSIKSIAEKCPAVSKKGGGSVGKSTEKNEKNEKVAPKPVLVATKTVSPTIPDDMTPAQWLAYVGNVMLAGRKMFPKKKAFIAAIGGLEEMLDEMKPLAA